MNSFIKDVQRYKNVYEKFGKLHENKNNRNNINVRTLSSISFLELSAESVLKSFLNLTQDEQKSFLLSCVFKRVLEYTKEISYLESRENLQQIEDYIQEKYKNEKHFLWDDIDTSVNPMFFHVVSKADLCVKVDEIRKWLADDLDMNKTGLNEQSKIVLQKLIIKSVDKIFTKKDSMSVELNDSYDIYVGNLISSQVDKNVKDNSLSLTFSIMDRDIIKSDFLSKLVEYLKFRIEAKDGGSLISLLNIKTLEKSNFFNVMSDKIKTENTVKIINKDLEDIQVSVDSDFLSLNFLKVFNTSLMKSPVSFFSDYSLRNYMFIMNGILKKISTEYDCNLYLDEKDNCLKFNAGVINKEVVSLFEQFASDLGNISFQKVQFAYGLKNEDEAVNDFVTMLNDSFETLHLLSVMLKENSSFKNESSLKVKVKKF